MANQQQNYATMCWKRENNMAVMIILVIRWTRAFVVLPLYLGGPVRTIRFAAMAVSTNSMPEFSYLL